MQPTGGQLARLAATLAEEEFEAEVAVGVLERAGGEARALEAARQALVDRLSHDPSDQTAKAAIALVETAITQTSRTGRRPVYAPCGRCEHKGAYLVGDRDVIRCKYCSTVRELTPEERALAELDLAAVASRLR